MLDYENLYPTDWSEKQIKRVKKIFHSKWYDINRRCAQGKKSRKNSCYEKITVEWGDEESFQKDMYEGFINHVIIFGLHNTTIDRINPWGNYSKENCRWATWEEQQNNKTNTLKVKIDNIEYDTKSFSKVFGISRQLACTRIRKYLSGCISLEQLISPPQKHHQPQKTYTKEKYKTQEKIWGKVILFNKEFDYKDIMRLTGLSYHGAHYRINLFRKGKITQEEVIRPYKERVKIGTHCIVDGVTYDVKSLQKMTGLGVCAIRNKIDNFNKGKISERDFISWFNKRKKKS